jgi:hypothetical protein
VAKLLFLTRDAPDTDLVGYPANLKARYQISGKARYSARSVTGASLVTNSNFATEYPAGYPAQLKE